MENIEKIQDLIKLLNMNQDHLCYELTSLASKVNNFLDDREMTLSRQLLSVMYFSLLEENDDKVVAIDTKENGYDIVEIDTEETVDTVVNDIPDRASPSFDDSPFVLVV
ncbi:MAG: hypothetical protein JSU79_10675 [Dehalococcoidales bacterium]|nr:MAG: hypothetical protein JSU79_10675 [Dehalococcoidales bacterium]